jgi:hypothetical protein
MQTNVASPTNVEPNTLLNAMGFGQLSDSTQWYFFLWRIYCTNCYSIDFALGAPTLTNTAWDIVLFAYPNVAGKIGYEIKKIYHTNICRRGLNCIHKFLTQIRFLLQGLEM